MIVCSCAGISEKRVVAAIADGACSREDVTALCGAGNGCGGCHRMIRLMIRDHTLVDARHQTHAAERPAA